MRILIVSNIYPPDGLGGYERQTAELCEAFAEFGHTVRVITTPINTRSIGNPDMQPFVKRVLHLYDEYTPAVRQAGVSELLKLQSRLVSAHNVSIYIDELRDFRPDMVLFSNLIGLGGLQLLATTSKLTVPWLWSLADVVPATLTDLGACDSMLSAVPLRRKGSRWCYSGIFAAPSKRLYHDIYEDGIDLSGALLLIPYWTTPTSHFNSRQYFTREGTLRLTFSSHVSEMKGIDIALRATALVVNSGRTNLKLDIYGGGETERYADEANALGLSNFVRFRGFRPANDMPGIFADHDVLLFPAMLREPFGNVTVQAMAEGCFPIINENCGAAEILENGTQCLKVERTAEAFSNAINSVYDGRYNLADIAANSRHWLGANLSRESAAQQYLKVMAEHAKPFTASTELCEQARLVGQMLERAALARLSKHLESEQTEKEALKQENAALKAALTQAKQGIEAFEQALTGANNRAAAIKSELDAVHNSRLWKLRRLLKPGSE